MTKTPPTVSLGEGWAIVPVEPTMLQLNAAADATGAGSGMSWNGLSPQRLFEQAWSAMLAASPAHTPAPDTRLPEGMVPWAGGDAAPADWDEVAPVLFRGGELSTSHGLGVMWFWKHQNSDSDIIAYTPHPAVEVTEKRAREVLATTLHAIPMPYTAECIRDGHPRDVPSEATIRAMLAFAASASTTEDGV